MGERLRNFEGYTGHIAENEVLGEVVQEQLGQENQFEGRYFTFGQAVDLVKNEQPFDNPTDPHEKPFPHDVHATIIERLSLDNYSQVRFYTAVGSPLDRLHGVDAFFELDLGDGEYVIATLDMTQNPHKRDYKADVVFQWPRDGIDRKDPDDRLIWQDKVNEVAKEISEVLKTLARVHKKTIRSLTEEEINNSVKITEERRQKRLLNFLHKEHAA